MLCLVEVKMNAVLCSENLESLGKFTPKAFLSFAKKIAVNVVAIEILRRQKQTK
jgi:hypothetical protein